MKIKLLEKVLLWALDFRKGLLSTLARYLERESEVSVGLSLLERELAMPLLVTSLLAIFRLMQNLIFLDWISILTNFLKTVNKIKMMFI